LHPDKPQYHILSGTELPAPSISCVQRYSSWAGVVEEIDETAMKNATSSVVVGPDTIRSVTSLATARHAPQMRGGTRPHMRLCSDRSRCFVNFLNSPQHPRANALLAAERTRLVGLRPPEPTRVGAQLGSRSLTKAPGDECEFYYPPAAMSLRPRSRLSRKSLSRYDVPCS